MSNFLERYEQGKHEQVWDELVALGAAVREEPLAADARAVAHETMRRARANVLTPMSSRSSSAWVVSVISSAMLSCSRSPIARSVDMNVNGCRNRSRGRVSNLLC